MLNESWWDSCAVCSWTNYFSQIHRIQLLDQGLKVKRWIFGSAIESYRKIPLTKNMQLKEVADKCFQTPGRVLKTHWFHIAIFWLRYYILIITPCKNTFWVWVIMAVYRDTRTLTYTLAYFPKTSGVGGLPQHLGQGPVGRRTLWVCSRDNNITRFFFPVFIVMMSVVGVVNACCYSFLSPSGWCQSKRTAAWPTSPFLWMSWPWTLGSWDIHEPPELQGHSSGQVLLTGLAMQQTLEDNSLVKDTAPKDTAPRACPASWESLACSRGCPSHGEAP